MKLRRNLSVVWLDFSNADGAIPHALIEFAMAFMWVPEKITSYIMREKSFFFKFVQQLLYVFLKQPVYNHDNGVAEFLSGITVCVQYLPFYLCWQWKS